MFLTVALVATVAFFASVHGNDCDPLKSICQADIAFGSTIACDFTKGDCDIFQAVPGAHTTYDAAKGAVFAVGNETDWPTINTGQYIFFGRVDAEVQAAPGRAIETGVVLQSDCLDEIDWTWVGSFKDDVQTGYYRRGDPESFGATANHSVSNPTGSFHNYSIEWTSSAIKWLVDGKQVRIVNAQSATGDRAFPQTPMQVKIGTFVGASSESPPKVIQLAGGLPDFSNGPFVAHVRSVTVVDYAGTSAPASGDVKAYFYGDKSGSWQSIKVIGTDEDDPTSGESSAGGLSVGAKAGIAVGAVVAAIVAAVLGGLFYRRRNRRKAAQKTPEPEVELDGENKVVLGRSELEIKETVLEMESQPAVFELDGNARAEKGDDAVHRHEDDSSDAESYFSWHSSGWRGEPSNSGATTLT